MSQEILIEELRRKSGDRLREMWREAEEKSESLRQEKKREFDKRREEEDRRLEEVKRDAAAPIIHEAEAEALHTLDDGLRELAERLYEKARTMLPQLRENDYPEFFAGLVDELPDTDWETVRVNEQDRELARSFFSNAQIKADQSVTGGFIAGSDKGRFRVTNTLERRLEKSWPYALPELLSRITGENDAVPPA